MKNSRPSPRRGFTLVELLIAGVITAFVLGSISVSLSNLGRAKTVSNHRLAAYLRADSAMNAMRRDIASIIRSDDLFDTRFQLTNHEERVGGELVQRDELLMFSNRLRPLRDIDFHGEGIEYETQYKILTDEFGSVLWLRRDALPDTYPLAGGVAIPLAEGIISVQIEAYDGDQWNEEWESDELGLPVAVRVTIVAGAGDPDLGRDNGPFATLRTVICIDRILLPKDRLIADELALIEEMQAAEQDAAVENALNELDSRSETGGETSPTDAGELDSGGSQPDRSGRPDQPAQNTGPARTLGGGNP